MPRFTLTRDFYIPKKCQETIKRDDLNAVVYHGLEEFGVNGSKVLKPVALGFSGKRQKPDFNYSFKNQERMTDHINKYFEGLESQRAFKEELKASRKKQELEMVDKINVDDILYDTWGYDQTNVDFYIVIAKRGRMVDVQGIGNSTVESTGSMSGYVMPNKEAKGKIIKNKRIGAHGLTIDSVRSAHPWHGKPVHETSYC